MSDLIFKKSVYLLEIFSNSQPHFMAFIGSYSSVAEMKSKYIYLSNQLNTLARRSRVHLHCGIAAYLTKESEHFFHQCSIGLKRC